MISEHDLESVEDALRDELWPVKTKTNVMHLLMKELIRSDVKFLDAGVKSVIEFTVSVGPGPGRRVRWEGYDAWVMGRHFLKIEGNWHDGSPFSEAIASDG